MSSPSAAVVDIGARIHLGGVVCFGGVVVGRTDLVAHASGGIVVGRDRDPRGRARARRLGGLGLGGSTRLRGTRRRRASAALRRDRPVPRASSRARISSSSSSAVAGHDDGDVAGALADPGGPAAGPGAQALERRALVGVAGRHEQLLGGDRVVVLGVGDGRVQALQDRGGRCRARRTSGSRWPRRRLAADEVEHLAGLVGRHRT